MRNLKKYSYYTLFLLASIRLVDSGCDRYGLSSSLYAVCGNCGMKEVLATGYHNTNDTLPRSNQGKDINRRIVYASYEMGVRKEGIVKLCEVLNVPFSMSKLTWYNHEDMLFEAHQDVVLAMVEKNREEARKIALEEDDVDKNDTTLAEVPEPSKKKGREHENSKRGHYL